jgi:EpsI family protein
MEKKTFVIFLCLIAGTFAATQLVSRYRAPVGIQADLEKLPLSKGEWVGRLEALPQPIVDLLNPDELFAASFHDPDGHWVQVFVDYYSPENTVGSIHSPRNCLPGSGWMISGATPREIEFAGRRISAVRFNLSLGKSRQVMDFWYITRMGETGDDYRLKFNTMIGSLILRPTDKAFVRFVTLDDPGSLAAMEEFERLFVQEIYRSLPF